jgi:hypothetical protein
VAVLYSSTVEVEWPGIALVRKRDGGSVLAMSSPVGNFPNSAAGRAHFPYAAAPVQDGAQHASDEALRGCT